MLKNGEEKEEGDDAIDMLITAIAASSHAELPTKGERANEARSLRSARNESMI